MKYLLKIGISYEHERQARSRIGALQARWDG